MASRRPAKCRVHGEAKFLYANRWICWRCSRKSWSHRVERQLVQGRPLPAASLSSGQLLIRELCGAQREVRKPQMHALLQTMSDSEIATDYVTAQPLGSGQGRLGWLADHTSLVHTGAYDFGDFHGLLNFRDVNPARRAYASADFVTTIDIIGKLVRGEPFTPAAWRLCVAPELGLVWGEAGWHRSLACYLAGYSIELPEVRVLRLKSEAPVWLQDLTAFRAARRQRTMGVTGTA